jgi:hypothetical protein
MNMPMSMYLYEYMDIWMLMNMAVNKSTSIIREYEPENEHTCLGFSGDYDMLPFFCNLAQRLEMSIIEKDTRRNFLVSHLPIYMELHIVDILELVPVNNSLISPLNRIRPNLS